jgi:formiminotetrahydrofolate cyclodeaminase
MIGEIKSNMYNEKIVPILNDLENKEIELAGGSVVGMVLSITNSLINYICNLTVGKKRYENVQEEVLKIKEEANLLKKETLKVIDKDKEVLEKILDAYKLRKEKPEELENASKEGVKFCITVMEKAIETLKLVKRIEKVGNKMLASDFKICEYYAEASVKASIVNVEVNLKSINDKEFVEEIRNILPLGTEKIGDF